MARKVELNTAFFLTTYADYSTTDLLKIVEQEYDYQPDAITAAKQLLATRTVTQEEIDAVKMEVLTTRLKTEKQKAKVNKVFGGVIALFQPMFKPTEKLDLVRWVYLFCIITFIYYLFSAYKSINYLYEFVNYIHGKPGIYELLQFGNLFYAPILIYLMVKRHKWGWILITATALFNLFMTIAIYVEFYRLYHTILNRNPFYFLSPVILCVIYIYFFTRKDVKAFFNISQKLAANTVIYTIVFSVLFNTALYFEMIRI